MPNLSVYNSKEEIEKYFDVKIIDNADQFKKFIEEHEREKDTYLYRGLKDASWKIFASSQREYLVNGMVNKFGSYNTYLKSIYDNSKKSYKNILEKFYKVTRQNLKLNGQEIPIPYNSYWAFSFLQHYGTPTPLIDFTGSLSSGLFFAWHGAKKVKNSYLLSDYVQINYFDKEKVKDSHINNFQSIMNYSAGKTIDGFPKTKEEALELFENNFNYFTIPEEKNVVFYIDRKGFIKPLVGIPLDIEFSIINLNIIAQEGLFLINFEESLCIEEQWNNANLPKINKTLIHKSLLNEIEDYLINTAGSSFESYYYPMEKEIAKDIYNRAIK